jgi:hypothetical protein
MRLWPECLNRSLSRMARAAAAEHVPVSRKGQSAAYRLGAARVDKPKEPIPV